MRIRRNAPPIAALLPNLSENRWPKHIPINDVNPVTKPIIIAGYKIDIRIKARLNPTANASILVAIERTTNRIPRLGSWE